MIIDFENPKRIWTFVCKNVTFELVNWRCNKDSLQMWNIYAYIYPEHAWYLHNAELMRQTKSFLNLDDSAIPPFHKGISVMYIHDDSIQLGCGYDHLGDDFYTIETDPYIFEHDIKALIEWFENYNSNGEIQDRRAKAPSDNGGQSLSLEDLYQIINREVMSEL